MSTQANDGGPAYPVVQLISIPAGHYVTAPVPNSGMSLRDWFAGQIAAGMANAAMQASASDKLTMEDFDEVMIGIPSGAYTIADAMLAERAKKKAQ